MEKIIAKIAALGVPGLVLTIAISCTGLAGGAAIIAALSALGPGGILGGIFTLGIIGLIAHSITEFGAEAIIKGVVKELLKKENPDEIKMKVDKYPISHSLKLKIFEYIDKYSIKQQI